MLSFASVPLYDLFCRVTGYGGTTQAGKYIPDNVLAQTVTITFNADVEPGLGWEFKPEQQQIKLRIGEQKLITYRATNHRDVPVTGVAVYNVTPHAVGPYFDKVECFCFKDQTLMPGESIQMPVSFFLDPEMAKDPELKGVHNITLSYTFFEKSGK